MAGSGHRPDDQLRNLRRQLLAEQPNVTRVPRQHDPTDIAGFHEPAHRLHDCSEVAPAMLLDVPLVPRLGHLRPPPATMVPGHVTVQHDLLAGLVGRNEHEPRRFRVDEHHESDRCQLGQLG